MTDYRYRLWGTDASGFFIEAIIAPYPKYRIWRCVTAFPMSPSTQKAYLRRIKMRLKREAHAWDSSIAKEKPEEISGLLDKAQLFVARRPPRQPVSVRLDPFDLALLKRIARNKGLPFTQLMSMWLHEKVEQEKTQARA
jgi:predicted DNA binding CopG/RHH family protein